ncbi:hypothetical protein MRB53_021499 [Persea americana]|uniref:Uncharacterized protein n=1 Tax=Persea americana TaxID=3435 RepID=A0ACC2L4A8_PERAE|nr:hypothetical protein MRB53_021499 [Persea americana]
MERAIERSYPRLCKAMRTFEEKARGKRPGEVNVFLKAEIGNACERWDWSSTVLGSYVGGYARTHTPLRALLLFTQMPRSESISFSSNSKTKNPFLHFEFLQETRSAWPPQDQNQSPALFCNEDDMQKSGSILDQICRVN